MNARAIVPATGIEPSEFEEIRTQWLASSAILKKYLQNREDMMLALNLATVGVTVGVKTHPDAVGLAGRAERFMQRAVRRPKQLLEDVVDLNDEIDAAKVEYERLNAIWQSACLTETNRLAEPLVPRHRAAVHRIALALEQLSVALSDEFEVRRELAEIAPMPLSVRLPDMGGEFWNLRQSDRKSIGAFWAAKARKLGFLDD